MKSVSRKKLFAAMLACIFAPSAAVFAACAGHTHTYAEEWTSSATHHWHEATCEHSGERSDYAEHSWDGGTVTAEAACETAGVMTYSR